MKDEDRKQPEDISLRKGQRENEIKMRNFVRNQ